ncbi:MAG TPA: acetyl-CoA carboxylase biotin carboxyl carrier protein [Abditibacteriaceae bacterium]|jgi:acetyl-CoA carboxylase biotin carboxyl carrier protein
MAENSALNSDEKGGEPTLAAQVQLLSELAAVVRESRLSELELEHEGMRLRLATPRRATPLAAPVTQAESATAYYEDAAEEDFAAAPVAAVSKGTEIVSPMVGIFYRAPSPSEPNFVEVGDRIEAGKTLGLVEAMKVFNEITSEISGTVTEIIVQNLALVETGDVLMRIQPD